MHMLPSTAHILRTGVRLSPIRPGLPWYQHRCQFAILNGLWCYTPVALPTKGFADFWVTAVAVGVRNSHETAPKLLPPPCRCTTVDFIKQQRVLLCRRPPPLGLHGVHARLGLRGFCILRFKRHQLTALPLLRYLRPRKWHPAPQALPRTLL